MQRLTKRLPNGVIHVDFAKRKESVMGRLASIEDILGDEYDLDRLRELVEFELLEAEEHEAAEAALKGERYEK